jgi:serine/threonine-protein kinase
VAVKVVLPRSARQLDAMQRLLREARTAATVVHPAVVRVHEVDLTEDGALYVVLERVWGETLRDTVQRLGALPPEAVAAIGAQLCGGLAAAHAGAVIHRDVKPSNVMVTGVAPGLRLLDFGIAIEGFGDADPTPGTADPLTEVGVVLGTPVFVDPAVVAGGPVTPAADVYAAGVTLFWCATGVLPRDPRADVRDRLPALPAALAQWISRCASPAPDARPTAAEAAAAFAALAGSEPLEVTARAWLATSGRRVG